MRVKLSYMMTAVAIAGAWIVLPGCSSQSPQTAPPVTIQDANPVSPRGGHQLWGFWLIGIDPETNQYEVLPARQAENHWNVLKWLEQGPCTNCLQITDFTDSDHGTKLVTVSIKHPFPNPNLTGFDVRGIAMLNGSHEFPTAGLNAPDASLGDGELINADGHTTLYNLTTVGCGPDGFQGYMKGKFATAAIPSAKLNGFKRYYSNDPANTRSAFYAGETISQVFDIDMPGSPFVLGYAVDASWAPPINKPVTDPVNDFPPQANCYEPYVVEATVTNGVLTDQGGMLTLEILVIDHQGPGSHQAPVLECPELASTFYMFETGPGMYGAYIKNSEFAPPGDYKLLISVEDNLNSESDPWIDLTAYKIVTIQVQEDQGWARTWGGSNWDRGNAVVMDSWGNAYIAGIFQGTVDFDPGPGTTELTSNNGSIDAFVSKFDGMGNFVWARTWGGPGVDTADGVEIDFYVHVVGEFEDTVDFNPGSGTDEISSNGGSDAYAIELAEDGHYKGTHTWGGTGDDTASWIVYSWNSDRLLVTGSFKDTVEFPGGQTGISNGQGDIYLVDLVKGHDLLGTWGGTGDDMGLGLAFKEDTVVLLTGAFQEDVNFNPDGMGGMRHCAGGCDALLAEYDTTVEGSPENQWVVTWGDTGYDYGNKVCWHPGEIYVTGSFQGTVDFNPTGGTDERISNGAADAYVLHYNSSVQYLGVTTWGGDDPVMRDAGEDIAVDDNGDVYAVGSFIGESFGTPSNGSFDGVVAGYDPDLNLKWTAIFGGAESDGCNGVATDYWDRIFVTGGFKDIVDFNPTAEVEEHTSNGGMADCFLVKLYSNGLW